MGEERWVKVCWLEKKKDGWKDLYGREREKYYNRNGWGIVAIDGMPGIERDLIKELRERERDVQRQEEERRIREAKYNKRYKIFMDRSRIPCYLEESEVRKRKNGEGIRALMRLRCGNMEVENKYWLKEEERNCVFCEIGKDSLAHFTGECEITKDWFKELGESVEERISTLENDSLDERKEKVLVKFWREKEKYKSRMAEEKREK